MIVRETRLKGVFIIDIDPIADERGFFAEGWKGEVAASYGMDANFNRTNISHNRRAGTVRGLHRQTDPHAEAKLVRCIRGSIFDVAVDVRPDSPTCRQWVGVELTADNYRMLYISRGFLHGFQTLIPETTVFYQVAGIYTPSAEQGARYDDPAFGIVWPEAEERTLSAKDQAWPSFASRV